ncbi:DNA-binding transcription factor cat8, partial [Elasticomyces elasticus]
MSTQLTDGSMATLQCLILAQLYCIQSGDYAKLPAYKGLAMSLASRMGLHHSQKRFALGALTCETRKKVFWTLYTLDCFTAVLLGVPKQLSDHDIHCEYPVDADDEYVTERGFQPTLPGEFTKLSSALALFRATRIMSRVLDELYPVSPSYEVSFQSIASLSEELDVWYSSLASHLKLQFVQDKPSTGTISSRSPLLSLTYHYIRCLIHRPAVCANLGDRSSASVMAMAGSCKHIVQIVELLVERALSFSFCLNKDELLVLSGFGLLFHGTDLDSTSKLAKDNLKTIVSIVDVLEKAKAPNARGFLRASASLVPIQRAPKCRPSTLSRHNSEGAAMAAPQHGPSYTRKQLKALASRFSAAASKYTKQDTRRATMPDLSFYHGDSHAQSQPDISSATAYRPVHVSRSEPARSPTSPY